MSKPTVLVIHALRPTSRQTTIDHLLAFREYLPNADVQYLHFAQPLPRDIAEGVAPDLLVVNYDYLNYRFSPLWPYIKNRHRDIARRARKVVAIAQDDFWAHRLLDNWCVSWDVDRVLTPIDNDLEVLYPRTSKRAEFRTVLTGYAQSRAHDTPPLHERPIDLGQRVRMMPPHLGKYAQEKADQAVRLATFAQNAGFIVDVSTRVEDSLVGDAWPRFLRQCKFTVGMKGGASIADPYGLLYNKVESYRHRHPDVTLTTDMFGFLKRRDKKYKFSAISPRLFEAASEGVCQILRPDNYLGVLEPGKHYIPLNDDFSNVDAVMSAMTDIDGAHAMVNAAREVLIESGQFGYQHLVSAACDLKIDATHVTESTAWSAMRAWLAHSAALSNPSDLPLHDSVSHLIHESLGRGVSDSAFQHVRQRLSDRNLTDWFDSMHEAMRQEPVMWRMPWIPRLISATPDNDL
jgi:hypothetical protein